jgi:RNA polymerase sigma-70 factor (ECF subfamily)
MGDDRREQVAELAGRYGRMVFATTYRILGRPEDAEDALQEVFLKILSTWRPRQTDAVRDWGAYLRAVATRCAVDLLRRRSRWQREGEQLSEEMEAPAGRDPRSLASRRQRARLLRQALARLPRRDARVFALRYFEDLSYKEIAAQMQLDVNQVGVILHRGRRRLQEILEPMMSPVSPGAAGARGTPQELGKENSHVST